MKKSVLIILLIYSFIGFAQNPGGVGTTGLTGWFKADSLPLGNVIDWPSSFPVGNNAWSLRDTTGAPYPIATATPRANSFNYNQAIDFYGNSTTNLLMLGKLGAVNLLDNNLSTSQGSVFMVYYLPDTFAGTTGGHLLHYRESAGDGIQYRHLGSVVRCAIGNSNSANASRDYLEDYKPMIFSYTGNKGTTTSMTGYKRGKVIPSGNASAATGDNGVIVGARLNANVYAAPFVGLISEVLFYNKTLTAPESDKVHSYLALKYGITLENTVGGPVGNYVAPNGTILWNAQSSAAYHNNVIGIGRDDAERLYQKQSHSLNDDLRIYVNYLANDNASNFSTIFNDSSYVIVGSTTHKVCDSDTATLELPANSGLYSRIERKWKITNTNFINTFNLDIKLDSCAITNMVNPSDLRLLVDEDGDFSNATVYSTSNGITFGYVNDMVSVWGISNVHLPIDSTRYFTIASASSATPLPVKFSKFNATLKNNSVLLNWETALEKNNNFFTVQKSVDGLNWLDIAKVKSVGNTNIINAYQSIDDNLNATTMHYKIMQTDFDGNKSFTAVKTITIGNATEEGILIAYPTIAQNTITLNVSSNNFNNLKVINTIGQDFTNKIQLIAGANKQMILDVNQLVNGAYIILLNNQKVTFFKN